MRPLRRGSIAAPLVACLALLGACGDDTDDDTTATSVAADASPSTSTAGSAGTTTAGPVTTSAAPLRDVDKPEVQIPAEVPTELVVTDLTTGSGPAAREGDTVVLDYVGVRSVDGVEFDNSYDGPQPFSVVLGAGRVIRGWDQGLVGVQAGGRRQLDIPAELAYGAESRGEVIRENEPLTFVVDVVEVVASPDPADAPDISIAGQPNVEELVVEDLVVGDGDEVQPGQTAASHLVVFRADTGEELASTWTNGSVEPIPYAEGQTLPGLVQGLEGMREGGRRQITVPYELAFGTTGNEEFGVPPETDLIFVVDLVAAY